MRQSELFERGRGLFLADGLRFGQHGYCFHGCAWPDKCELPSDGKWILWSCRGLAQYLDSADWHALLHLLLRLELWFVSRIHLDC